jgi:hypothetical protein
MYRNPEKVSDVLALIRRLLSESKPKEAIDRIRRFGATCPELSNAYGVCLMRAGETAKAIELYRNFCIGEGGVCLRPDVPIVFKTNFATALLLAGNVAGCLSVLQEISREHDAGVVKLRVAIARWKRSLTWLERCWFAMSGEAPKRPVVLDFPPGDLDEPRELRPAA